MFYRVTLSRSYKDEQGNYQETNSYTNDELLRIARLAERTYDGVIELRRAKDRQDNGT